MADEKKLRLETYMNLSPQRITSGVVRGDTGGRTYVLVRLETAVGSLMLPLDAQHARALGEEMIRMADSIASGLVVADPSVIENIKNGGGHA